MGTPDFAVAPLDALVKSGYNVAAVVTAPDKQAGRGLKIQESAVKKYAVSKGLRILQPEKLKSQDFLDELNSIQPDLQIAVAFRMLPEIVWKLPISGTFNLHASLLPQYRGAAPINWAIINGEEKTGVTTFFINENIDTGNILMSAETPVLPTESAGELHDRLMHLGADLVLKTVRAIENKTYDSKPQQHVTSISELKSAPKIYKEDCRINWNQNADKVFNLIRGLSPYPAAFTELISPDGSTHYIKVFHSTKEISQHNFKPGKIVTDGKTHLSIAVTDGFIHLQEVQLSAKKKMPIYLFLRGFSMNSEWKAVSIQQ
jgi:methionyl-tRNA formyltransferase